MVTREHPGESGDARKGDPWLSFKKSEKLERQIEQLELRLEDLQRAQADRAEDVLRRKSFSRIVPGDGCDETGTPVYRIVYSAKPNAYAETLGLSRLRRRGMQAERSRPHEQRAYATPHLRMQRRWSQQTRANLWRLRITGIAFMGGCLWVIWDYWKSIAEPLLRDCERSQDLSPIFFMFLSYSPSSVNRWLLRQGTVHACGVSGRSHVDSEPISVASDRSSFVHS